jgi:hypothetical protein
MRLAARRGKMTTHTDCLHGFALALADLVRIGHPCVVREVVELYDLRYEDLAAVVHGANLKELRELLPFCDVAQKNDRPRFKWTKNSSGRAGKTEFAPMRSHNYGDGALYSSALI